MISPELFGWLLVTLWGACVGSFLNVVIYRVPAGLSVVSPPSRCPHCEQKLAWHDNVPVLGWLVLRGRCRTCRSPISRQYPMVEAFTALAFAAVYWVLFLAAEPAVALVDGVLAGQAFRALGVAETWPVLAVLLLLIAVMVASTKIDAALFIIPLSLPWVVLLLTPLAYVASAVWQPSSVLAMPLNGPVAAWSGFLAVGGWCVSMMLLRLGVLRRSFADEAEVLEQLSEARGRVDADGVEAAAAGPGSGAADDPETSGAARRVLLWAAALIVSLSLPLWLGWLGGVAAVVLVFWLMLLSRVDPQTLDGGGDVPAEVSGPLAWLRYPHARREMRHETMFLALPAAGLLMPWVLQDFFAGGAWLPLWLTVAGNVAFGAAIGATLVWGTRVLGTLAFGKEAMGLGDVHLMAAVGAVLGPIDVTLAFFVAPFVGLFFVALQQSLAGLTRTGHTAVPYGPSLCLGALIVLGFGGRILDVVLSGTGEVPLGPAYLLNL